MDKELKAKWVAALRSGEYKQGHYWLRKSADAFCCLGVLCSVAGRTVEMEQCCDDDYRWVKLEIGESATGELWKRNDGCDHHDRHSFAEIADYIEANL